MRRLCLWAVLFAASSSPLWAAKNPVEGKRDLFVLGCASNQSGQPGKWDSIGGQRAWGNVLPGVATILKRQLYTIENDGTFQATDLISGKRTQINDSGFDDPTSLFVAKDNIYAMFSNGNLTRVNRETGVQANIGAEGAWKGVRARAVFHDELYVVDAKGALQKADLGTGACTAIGKPDFKDVSFLFAADHLFALKTTGDLLRINLTDGSATQVGAKGAWKDVRAGAVRRARLLYTAEGAENDEGETATKIWETDLSTGKRAQFTNKAFGDLDNVFVSADTIYIIENNGSLKSVRGGEILSNKGERDGLNEWNCFAEQFETVFKMQARSFHNKVHSRLLMGNELNREKLMDSIAWVRQNATKNDLFFMYITTHGDTSPETGWKFVIAGDGDVVTANELKEEMAQLPCQVVLFIESCTSGGFIKCDMPVPDNMTVICGSLPEQLMDNELDIAMFEGLYGRADFDKNGIVDLDEIMRYIELRFKEDSCNGRAHLIPVMCKSKNISGSLPMTRVAPNLAAVVHNGVLWSALLEKKIDDKYQIFLLGFDTLPSPYFRTAEVSLENIIYPNEGQPLLVKRSDDSWCAARIIGKGEGEKCKVRYIPDGDEEVVTKDRIQYPFAGKPEAEAPAKR